MNENKATPAVEETAVQPLYSHPYYAQDGKLYIEKQSRSGTYLEQLCNFTPRIVSEITFDDGQTVRKEYRIGGEDENGNPLPEVDVAADDLSKMDWLANHWPATLRLSVVSSVEKHVQCAMKETAVHAEQKYVFAHTGWIEIDGKFYYLLPNLGEHEVRLCGKQKAYCGANTCKQEDVAYLNGFLQVDFIPHPVMLPCLALVFLSPLNEFLLRGGCEPKFILSLIGRTGSMKSTVAALMLSFFGHFTATELPMSFHDTANSILYNAGTLKDVLTCVDDYHPSAKKDGEAMRQNMQILVRGYGDRTARERMTSDIRLRESQVPHGNVIVTAEYAPDIGESGTARTFIIEMQPRSMNLPLLTEIQELAADGMLMRCMFGYIEWLKETYLTSADAVQNFVSALKQKYLSLRTAYREELQNRRIVFHDRLPDTLTCLHIGFDMLLKFLMHREMLKEDAIKEQREKFKSILLAHAAKQSDAVITDKPTHIFIRKLFAMIECGQASLVRKDASGTVSSSNLLGYEDDDYCYIFFEASHKAVSKFCADQNEVFTITTKALAKQLAEEELIEVTDSGKNTRSLPFCGVNKRVMLLKKSAVKDILDGI